jgi:hypothetical protein
LSGITGNHSQLISLIDTQRHYSTNPEQEEPQL